MGWFVDDGVKYVTHRHRGDRRIESPALPPFEKNIKRGKIVELC